jgi:5'-deoxynucleotidase YfbR-like HD superfamily hydrolase
MMPATKNKTKAVLTPPHDSLADLVEVTDGITTDEHVKIRVDSPYARSPITYIQGLEAAYPHLRFEHECKRLSNELWMYIWIDVRSQKKIQPVMNDPVRMGKTGRMVDPFSLSIMDLDLRDIAHHLARICRFNGGATGHYSVAEHSIRVAGKLPKELKLWGLLHDAGETYLGDITRPVKKRYEFIEKHEMQILKRISERFDLVWPVPAEVWQADDEMLQRELKELEAGTLFGENYQNAERKYTMALNHHLKNR